MAFNIKNDEADELLRELSELTGETLTTAVIVSLRERLQREMLRTTPKGDRLAAAIAHLQSLPVLEDLTADDILQWDENGLPI